MKKYKPEYLGKVLPDEGSKRKDFLQDEYESFSDIYDICKDESDNITDIKNVSEELGSQSLNIKITTTSEEVLDRLTEKVATHPDDHISIDKDVIGAKPRKVDKDVE